MGEDVEGWPIGRATPASNEESADDARVKEDHQMRAHDPLFRALVGFSVIIPERE